MFEFNKRDVGGTGEEFPPRSESSVPGGAQPPQAGAVRRSPSTGEAAVIGPSIHIEGDLHGEEDLIIEGEVKGTVHLKHHSLTIGSQGKVTANVYANAVNVDGFMHGDLYGAERISIRKSAQVKGNISSPRVSLEDGAQFKGSIEMDPDSEALQSAFGERRSPGRGTAAPGKAPIAGQAGPSSASKPEGAAPAGVVKTGKSA